MYLLLLVACEVAGSLFVIYQLGDGGSGAANGARVAVAHLHRPELHGLGIEGQQPVGQQLAHAREIFQRLGCLNGSQHAGNGSKHTSLRAGGHSPYRRRLLEHAAIASGAWQMGERLAVETQDAPMRERLMKNDGN